MDLFIRYFFYLIIYSFLGYLCEVIYVAIRTKKITNRGFLYGPVVPIYGFGALIIILCLTPLYNLGMWYFVFILGVILTSGLEYLTSYAMELIFHMRWWDYSNKKFNINGRVCLLNSTLFGILVMVVMYVIHPFLDSVLDKITNPAINISLFFILLVFLLTDFILSIIKHINISKMVFKFSNLVEAAQEKDNEFKDYISNTKTMKKLSRFALKHPSLKIRFNGKPRRFFSEFIFKASELSKKEKDNEK